MIYADTLYDETIKDGLTIDEIIYLYIAHRLQVLKTRKDLTSALFNTFVEFIADNYVTNNYSIDSLVNAFINYVNAHDEYPMAIILNNDTLALLEDYSNEEND